MKFINKLRNRLKKITGSLPNAKPDSDVARDNAVKNPDKALLPDPKKGNKKFNKPKREIDPGKTGIKIDLVRNKSLVLSPVFPGKRNTRWSSKY
jgi:hypothetical protein